MSLSRWLERAWYRRDGEALWALRPLECLYRRIVTRRLQQRRYRQQTPVPTLVVGNLSVGGTGKSPLVAWLAHYLREQGWQPGIVSRGYGGKAAHYPLRVTPDSSPAEAGDEPVMLAQQSGVPVAVAPDRPAAVALLVAEGCDLIISDDGLQHYTLARDVELVVVDGTRGFGNRHCLPCGPLREPLSRLNSIDAVMVNGGEEARVRLQQDGDLVSAHSFSMTLAPRCLRHLQTGERAACDDARFQQGVHAVAGIGHPERFFTTLASLGIVAESHPFADHHTFTADDLQFSDERPIVMTAKDAVKCQPFATEQCWALDVDAEPSAAFVLFLQQRLAELAPR